MAQRRSKPVREVVELACGRQGDPREMVIEDYIKNALADAACDAAALAFIDEDNAVSVFAGTWNGAGMCAHKDLPIATTTCCPSEDDASAAISCNFNGEKVSYATNEARCGSANICPAGTNSISDTSSCTQNTGYDQWKPNNNFFQWTKGSCSMKVKVRLDGQIAIIHQPEGISRV